MSTFRTGLLLASLFLSACTMPILQDTQDNKAENNPNLPPMQNNTTPSDQNTVNSLPSKVENNATADSKTNHANEQKTKDTTSLPPAVESKQTTADDTVASEQAQLEDNIQRATSNFVELKQRTGNAPEVPTIFTLQTDNAQSVDDSLQELRAYISKTNTALAVLNARVEDRQDMAANGDIIRIFVSEATVNHGQSSFKAQPIVGQWVRGESRVIRLKDNILFENPQSEDLQIAFSETYQLIVNGQVISIVNPNKEKSNADFSVSTKRNGKITGSLDYRIVEDK